MQYSVLINKIISDDYSKNYSEDKYINLSVDVTNYKPISIEEINKIMIKLNEVIEGLEFVNDGLDTHAYFNSNKNI